MRRRALLAALAGGLAGCGALPTRETPSSSPTPTASRRLARQGFPPDVCASEPVDLGIYAVDDPAFAGDWAGVDVDAVYAETGRLADDSVVVGIERDGRARAYPLSVLWKHEVVNDRLPPGDGGEPLVVTYCSLCRSGMVADRVVEGEPLTFGVSGQLWQPPEVRTRAAEADNGTFAVETGDADPGSVRNTGNLVMADVETGSYWSQLLATAICGPHREAELSVVPASTATWADWRDAHPRTDVLLPPPYSGLLKLAA